MMKNYSAFVNFRLFFIFIFACFLMIGSAASLYATHIRAGEITAKRISADGLTWEFTLTMYIDVVTSPVRNEFADFNFGDGSAPKRVRYTSIDRLPEYGSERYTYITTHTYSSPGTYTIKYTEVNRNGTVQNIASPDQNSFYIETKITIDPGLEQNTTPRMLYPPLDIAALGQVYEHNPGAFDEDGDSLSYKLIIPRQTLNGQVISVSGYRDPASFGGTAINGGPSTFTLDPVTGYMVWDTPGALGEFNVAFEIQEWRKMPDRNNPGQLVYRQVGYVVRDMQILVKDADNRKPILELPIDTCVVAGTKIEKIIKARDPDGHRVTITAYGGPLVTGPDTARFVSAPLQPSPASGVFTWQTQCENVRSLPYEVLFRAEDDPPGRTKLVDLQTYRITVVGPPPTNLVAQAVNESIELTWDPYTCANASGFQVYRREGPSGFIPEACTPGVPEGLGFVKIADLPAGSTAYTDRDGATKLEKGTSYCYLIVAVFPAPGGGLSIASNEACARLVLDVPVMTKVSVETTDASQGSIRVEWTRPLELDSVLYPGPYRYTLFRSEGFGDGAFTEIYTTTTATDTSYLDVGINTLDNPYSYRVAFYTSDDMFKDSTAIASSVRLTPSPGINQVQLNWEAQVPWNNNNRQHYIYREIDGQPVLIDSILAVNNNYSYVDSGAYGGLGLETGIEYCYYVTTQGMYDDPMLPMLLLNNSQRACAVPIDTVSPCPPVLAIDTLICGNCQDFEESVSFVNNLSWFMPDSIPGKSCDAVIESYNIYYTPYEEDSLVFLVNTRDTAFVHGNLTSFAGCYEVTAVDRFGNESPRSNRVCKDNCEFFELPNVFTPNGDGLNELFRPTCAIPSFIQSVKFTVYNRWGKKVHYSDNDIMINWNGALAGEGGEKLSAGTYFYIAEVTFKRLRRSDELKTFRGWVEIMR
jgi:gliding motility-associated-like protein